MKQSKSKELNAWIQEVAELTQPERIHWCDGSVDENEKFISEMVKNGDFIKLNQDTYPNSYLHRSDPGDVARVEHLTFVCTSQKDEAGPNNHWMDPKEGHSKVDALFKGCMKGRTMYVIPYCMGPLDSPFSRCGVELTDSLYVVVNMRIMTRIGEKALERIEAGGSFVKGLHSVGDLDPQKRLIMHFPEELLIKSIGSGYGGNALLGKKCHALRIASYQAQREGWLAEHMLILGLENPQGETHYIVAAFPSACGKTNLAMLIPPDSFPGYKVWTVGDDIAWLHLGDDGRLYAINPESGYFGVAPGTSAKTNPNALNMLNHDAIFTNVALTPDNEPWWEDMSDTPPPGLKDWQGRDFDKKNGPAAHPNSRFTVSAKQCASYSKEAENPRGVPISAIVFGGRRKGLTPLVYEAKSWDHGVLVGASVGSETTAAATGAVGVVRRDPMAMKPFCGYNFADYWSHWLSFADKTDKLPKIFHVNWFRKSEDGRFLWPGFGDNLRVLNWMIQRCENKVDAVEHPIGYFPKDIDTTGLEDFSTEDLKQLLEFDAQGWTEEFELIADYFKSYGSRMPQELLDICENIKRELRQSGSRTEKKNEIEPGCGV
jgi:phosphoenolpyruvate carboxykinase (GTP)